MNRHVVFLLTFIVAAGCGLQPRDLPPPPQLSPNEATQAAPRKEIEKERPRRIKAISPAPRWRGTHPALNEPVSISAYGLPALNVLKALIPEQLNMEVQEGVDLSRPATVKATRKPLGDVLLATLTPLGYSFKEERGTVMVFETDTVTYDLPILSLTQDYNANITNQTTTQASSSTTGSTGGTTSGSSTSSSSSNNNSGALGQTVGGATLGSEVSLRTFNENANIWDEVERHLAGMTRDPERFVVDRISGRVTVSAKAPTLAKISDYMEQLKKEYARQAILDVKILEVTVTNDNERGVDWEAVFGAIGDAVLKFSTGQAFTQNLTSPSPVFSVIDSTGINTSQLIVQALEKQGEVRILSQPKLLVRNNSIAIISVGQVIPFIDRVETTISNGTVVQNPNLSSVQDGVILTVNPKIREDNTITLHLTPVVSRVTEFRKFMVAGSEFEAPQLDTRNLSTIIETKDGQTVVLGGLISQNRSNDRQAIPILGRIPYLGFLAEQVMRKDTQSELVIVLTPRVQT